MSETPRENGNGFEISIFYPRQDIYIYYIGAYCRTTCVYIYNYIFCVCERENPRSILERHMMMNSMSFDPHHPGFLCPGCLGFSWLKAGFFLKFSMFQMETCW